MLCRIGRIGVRSPSSSCTGHCAPLRRRYSQLTIKNPAAARACTRDSEFCLWEWAGELLVFMGLRVKDFRDDGAPPGGVVPVASTAGGHLARHHRGSGTCALPSCAGPKLRLEGVSDEEPLGLSRGRAAAQGIHFSVPELPATRHRSALRAMRGGSARGGSDPAASPPAPQRRDWRDVPMSARSRWSRFASRSAPRRRRSRGRGGAASARAGVAAAAVATRAATGRASAAQ